MQDFLMTAAELMRIPKHPNIDFANLARGSTQELSSFIGKLDVNLIIDDTLAKGHAYFLQVDGNGRPRVDAFTQELVNFALEYAIPRKNIDAAIETLKNTGSAYQINALQRDARNLFTDLEKSGEGGELLLFWFAERVLKLPQIISKMSLKTSSNMHIHGSDGVHADVDPDDGMLRLYWCESKIYGSVTKGITAALAGVYKFLAFPFRFGGTQGNDIRLLHSLSDLGDPAMTKALKQFLNPTSKNFNTVKNCAICFVGGTSDGYITSTASREEIISQINTSLSNALQGWLTHTRTRISKLKIKEFIIHVIYLPMPDADDFRAKLKLAVLDGTDHVE